MKVLVTGAAGFIGFHVSKALLERGEAVVGLDNLNDYYDVRLKRDRLQRLEAHPGFAFERADVADRDRLLEVFERGGFERVVHLAAQASIRYSLTHPEAYTRSNLDGFASLLDACRRHPPEHLVFASSSSVYGANQKLPFSVSDNVDHPLSLYAATKKSNELTAHVHAHIYGLPVTGLRFFTVYGPWGRPDMSYFKFVRAILNGEAIDLYNRGEMKRDFTYIDDIVEGVLRVADLIPAGDPEWSGLRPDPASSRAPYRLYNIGNGTPVGLVDFVSAIEDALGAKAEKRYLPLQPGDLPATHADVVALERDVGFRPQTDIRDGIREFVRWYREYYRT